MNELGKRAENLAIKYLEERGYKIVERNWRCGHLEIDIIAINPSQPLLIHFIEVKGRLYPTQMTPEMQVNKGKQMHLINAANGYLKKERLTSEVVFDIIAILFKSKDYEIKFIENAFMPLW